MYGANGCLIETGEAGQRTHSRRWYILYIRLISSKSIYKYQTNSMTKIGFFQNVSHPRY